MLFLLHVISLDSQFTSDKTGMAGAQGSQSINNNLIRPGDDVISYNPVLTDSISAY